VKCQAYFYPALHRNIQLINLAKISHKQVNLNKKLFWAKQSASYTFITDYYSLHLSDEARQIEIVQRAN